MVVSKQPAWVKILTQPVDGKWAELPQGWHEIMTGKKMADWVEQQDPSSWANPYKGIYWLSPEVYLLWKLTWR